MLPSLNSMSGFLMKFVVSFNDKGNDNKAGKEKAGEIEEAQVFNWNGDTIVLEKRKLSHHQEPVPKSKNPKELGCPRYVPIYENCNACCKSQSNDIKGLWKKKRKTQKQQCIMSRWYLFIETLVLLVVRSRSLQPLWGLRMVI